MASHTQVISHGRRLFELLDEQQEPFLLEVYLLENGYSCRVLKTHTAMKCWPIYACKKLHWFNNHGFKRKGGMMLSCFLSKLVHLKLIRKALNQLGDDRTSWFNFGEEDLDLNKHLKKNQESKQLSPVSVLELHSDEGCSAQNTSVEEENLSTSSLNSEMSELPIYAACSSNLYQHTEGSKALLQSKKLLMKCVNEIEGQIWGSHDSLGQGLVFSLEKQRSDVARIAQLIDVDIFRSKREWSHFQAETREVGMKIEGFIFEEMREEVVHEMLGSHCQFGRG